MPEELAPISQGNSICTVKFADPRSNEHLLVFMNYGEVYLLDTVSEKYTQQKDGRYELCQLRRFSTIEVKDGLCLSVSDKGDGLLHRIDVKTKTYRTAHNTTADKVIVTMEQLYSFKLHDQVSKARFCVNYFFLETRRYHSGQCEPAPRARAFHRRLNRRFGPL